MRADLPKVGRDKNVLLRERFELGSTEALVFSYVLILAAHLLLWGHTSRTGFLVWAGALAITAPLPKIVQSLDVPFGDGDARASRRGRFSAHDSDCEEQRPECEEVHERFSEERLHGRGAGGPERDQAVRTQGPVPPLAPVGRIRRSNRL